VSQQAQTTCLHEAVASLREAYNSGLPPKRLEDASLASLAGTDEYKRLLEEVNTATIKASTNRQAALSGGK
jgi:hypothetical protein